jgi:hypothetical protein
MAGYDAAPDTHHVRRRARDRGGPRCWMHPRSRHLTQQVDAARSRRAHRGHAPWHRDDVVRGSDQRPRSRRATSCGGRLEGVLCNGRDSPGSSGLRGEHRRAVARLTLPHGQRPAPRSRRERGLVGRPAASDGAGCARGSGSSRRFSSSRTGTGAAGMRGRPRTASESALASLARSHRFEVLMQASAASDEGSGILGVAGQAEGSFDLRDQCVRGGIGIDGRIDVACLLRAVDRV